MKTIVASERLLIREAGPKDSEFILELLNSPNWLEFIGDRGVKTEKQALTYIETSLRHSYSNHGFGLYVVILQESITPIGLCGFLQRDYLDHPDIGFATLPSFEGFGYTFEACSALMGHAKQSLQLKSILGITTPSNLKSRNLLTKIGLVEAGTVIPPGKKEELLLFSN
ncbi:GNAT family N-acetyltransferase [Flagellimonas algicola]|uniref:GNAT family N-acetyltransferase n=1 Tax=Flagellimonas algicola TaxID=2583815 RepID=A0ABY2WQU4_9FLAO|nr:GNAT family N-acetyltransferase [Allomuricauda algicola]TMU57100.1 GNAT family N-acetyltransferase [Allomuricauda algicola]